MYNKPTELRYFASGVVTTQANAQGRRVVNIIMIEYKLQSKIKGWKSRDAVVT